MKYVQATNTGKGFITHADQQLGHISNVGANIYAVPDVHTAWIARVGAVEKTKAEAEQLVLAERQASWDEAEKKPLRTNETAEQRVKELGPRPTTVTLPV